ncbi:hypothetical protein EXS74_00610 [Candidatus Woesearchaeota archaeon]|nr:hypothetical protein [Candidatus Woesearchaeota archaeon]
MRRIPIIQRGNEGNPPLETSEFLVQHLPNKPGASEPPGRKKGAINQYIILVHRDRKLVEERIVDNPEAVGRIFVESYPRAQLLLNLDSEPYQRVQAYIQSCRSEEIP